MRYLWSIFAAITTRSPEKVIRVAERMSLGNRRIDRRRLEKEVAYLLNKYREYGPEGTKMGTVGLEMLFVFGSNGISVPPDYALLSKAVLCRRGCAYAGSALTSKWWPDPFSSS